MFTHVSMRDRAGSNGLPVTLTRREKQRHRHPAPSGNAGESQMLNGVRIDGDDACCHKRYKSSACKGENMSNLSKQYLIYR